MLDLLAEPGVAPRKKPTTPLFHGRKAGAWRGTMNKVEALYAAELERQKVAGIVAWYAFEALTFRLAKLTTYTPDFIVMLADGEIQGHEVKGFWQPSGRVKVKVAAEMFPMRFIAVTKGTAELRGTWVREVFGPADDVAEVT